MGNVHADVLCKRHSVSTRLHRRYSFRHQMPTSLFQIYTVVPSIIEYISHQLDILPRFCFEEACEGWKKRHFPRGKPHRDVLTQSSLFLDKDEERVKGLEVANRSISMFSMFRTFSRFLHAAKFFTFLKNSAVTFDAHTKKKKSARILE